MANKKARRHEVWPKDKTTSSGGVLELETKKRKPLNRNIFTIKLFL